MIKINPLTHSSADLLLYNWPKCKVLLYELFAILDVYTFRGILYTAAREVVNCGFHIPVFSFHILNSCLLFSKGNNLAKVAPRLCRCVILNRTSRNMKSSICDRRTAKCTNICIRQILA